MIWGNLLHLSYNFWWDRPVPTDPAGRHYRYHQAKIAQPRLRCDTGLWQEITGAMAAAGANLVLIDLGDGVRYDSHPEIAVDGAWTPGELRAELARLRHLGLEPIPKLNFSTCHDVWLGPYERQVSTPVYYAVVQDLIAEAVALFDQPRFVHLGYDEETAENQVHQAWACMRQHELWWHDLRHAVGAVEAAGSRAWIWSDYAWKHPAEFMAQMPRSVLQSNWYYDLAFAADDPMVSTFARLEAAGFEQVPTGSNYIALDNLVPLTRWCRKHLGAARLKGFLQTPWVPTEVAFRDDHRRAVDRLHETISAATAVPGGR